MADDPLREDPPVRYEGTTVGRSQRRRRGWARDLRAEVAGGAVARTVHAS